MLLVVPVVEGQLVAFLDIAKGVKSDTVLAQDVRHLGSTIWVIRVIDKASEISHSGGVNVIFWGKNEINSNSRQTNQPTYHHRMQIDSYSFVWHILVHESSILPW